MIIPSIDIMNGRAVQLRRGRDLILDGGDPLERLEQFAVAGEVAVVDLDAALGRGSNEAVISQMVRAAPCRVGGGIRSIESAVEWLDRGARKIVVGTSATVDFCSQLPSDRVIAAVDSDHRRVVVEGWETETSDDPIKKIEDLRDRVAGFLLTQVEFEGAMAGFDWRLVRDAVRAAAGRRITAAGGIATPENVAQLDRLGADAQVGMALYSGSFTVGEGVGAVLERGVNGRLWPTTVCNTRNELLGLAWSTRESLARAVDERRGIYWSRSRNELWIKGATSGNSQRLVDVAVDCDRDAIRFRVEQEGSGFCHDGSSGCWSDVFALDKLQRILEARSASLDTGSGSARLLADPVLLKNKLVEEARELAAAATTDEIAHEAADLLYFTMVSLVRGGVDLHRVVEELERRSLRVTRRPMSVKQIRAPS